MSLIKRWLEDHIDDISDEELLKGGWEQKDIDFMRDCFGKKEKKNDIK